jgi:CTP-dependent riboflavin kinase
MNIRNTKMRISPKQSEFLYFLNEMPMRDGVKVSVNIQDIPSQYGVGTALKRWLEAMEDRGLIQIGDGQYGKFVSITKLGIRERK